MGELAFNDMPKHLKKKIEWMDKLLQRKWSWVVTCHVYSVLLMILLNGFNIVELKQISLVVNSFLLQFCLIAVGTCIAWISIMGSFINNRSSSDLFYWKLVFKLMSDIDSFLSNIVYFLFVGISLRILLVTQERFLMIFFLYVTLFLSFWLFGILIKYVMSLNFIIQIMNVSKINTYIEYNEKHMDM